jgi:NifU-like protein
MSQANLFTTTHFDAYGFKVQSMIKKPINYGAIDEDEAAQLGGELFVYRWGSAEAGEAITLYWVVEAATGTIKMSRFEHFGSPVARAANDMLCMLSRNKTAQEVQEITYKSLEYFLRDNPTTPALDEAKQYTFTHAMTAASEAADAYLGNKVDEEGAQIVCADAQITYATIEAVIRLHDLESVEQITHYTKAGFMDRTCENTLGDILRKVRAQMAEEAATIDVGDDTPFAQMNDEQKIARINGVIDQHIRHFLVMDGGDMEIVDLKNNGEHTDLYIRYLGACNGCASASTGTLFAIENALKTHLDKNIRVLPV